MIWASSGFFVSVADKGVMSDFVGLNEEVASDEWLVARTELAAWGG
jgi:hypothetical protein